MSHPDRPRRVPEHRNTPISDLNQANGPLPSPEEQVRKYRTIAEDLDRIARGWHPTESELYSAPILRAWRMIEHPVPHLIGTDLTGWLWTGLIERISQD